MFDQFKEPEDKSTETFIWRKKNQKIGLDKLDPQNLLMLNKLKQEETTVITRKLASPILTPDCIENVLFLFILKRELEKLKRRKIEREREREERDRERVFVLEMHSSIYRVYFYFELLCLFIRKI